MPVDDIGKATLEREAAIKKEDEDYIARFGRTSTGFRVYEHASQTTLDTHPSGEAAAPKKPQNGRRKKAAAPVEEVEEQPSYLSENEPPES